MATTPTTPTKNPSILTTLYDIPSIFGQFFLTGKILTKEELTALQTTLKMLSATQKTGTTKTTPAQKSAFDQWLEARGNLTADQIFNLEAESPILRKLELAKGYEITATNEEQLKAEYEADVRELEQQNPEELKALEEEINQGKAQLQAEYEADLRVLEQEGPEELQKLEEELQTGRISFDNWADERSTMTEDEIFALEAESQGLTKLSPEELAALTERDLAEAGGLEPTVITARAPMVTPTVKPELIIKTTAYPKWWKDSLNAKIDFTAPGSRVLATVSGSLRLFVATIAITVTGETQISFLFGNAGSSGPIYLGGEGQPMGIVIAMGNSPAPCGSGNLSISATDPGGINPSIGGWATCFVEEATK